MASNISQDLIWEICRNNTSTLVKRRSAGGVQLSRDPLNLLNKHTPKFEGTLADKAIGVQPGPNGGVTLTTKKTSVPSYKPAAHYQSTTIPASTSTRKTYRSIVNSTAKRNYRTDLAKVAVARASAIRKSQKPVKKEPAPKLRGAKAKKATEV